MSKVHEATAAPDSDLLVPEATPAAADLVCWIWAAVPPKRGRIHVARAAAAFGVSERTLRRWLADPGDHELNDVGLRRANQLAILRSKGHLLWPDLDGSSRARTAGRRRTATLSLQLIDDDQARVPSEWHTDGRLEPHQVLLLAYPRAHTYALTATREPKTRRRLIAAGGEVLAEVTVPNRFSADLTKYAALETVDAHRCVAPQALVPIGRTDCWRETGGHQRPALALWRATGDSRAVDTATAQRITGRPAAQLEALAAEGALATLPGPAGQVWARPALEDLALTELDRRQVTQLNRYWVTMTEAARTLGVSRQHAHRLRAAGKFPAWRTPRGLWVARRSDLPS